MAFETFFATARNTVPLPARVSRLRSSLRRMFGCDRCNQWLQYCASIHCCSSNSISQYIAHPPLHQALLLPSTSSHTNNGHRSLRTHPLQASHPRAHTLLTLIPGRPRHSNSGFLRSRRARRPAPLQRRDQCARPRLLQGWLRRQDQSA